MRRMRSILLAVVLLAGLVSCGNGGGPDGVKIYYAVRGAEGYEQAAIQSENWSDAPEEVTMDDLFPRLLTPPVDGGRYVVFPENVRLLGWTLEEGLLTVDLSTLEPTPSALLLLLLVGVVHTGIAYVLYFGGIACVPAQTAALLSYIDPVVAVILSLTILKEPMSPTAALGAVLVIGAMIISEITPQKD